MHSTKSINVDEKQGLSYIRQPALATHEVRHNMTTHALITNGMRREMSVPDHESDAMDKSGGAAAGSMRFRILGPIEYWNSSGWHSVQAAKQRCLLAALILRAGQVVSAEHLRGELWDHTPPASANTLLAGYIWRLRRALGDGDGRVILTRAPGYLLLAPPGCLDVERYDAHLTRAYAHLAADHPHAAARFFTDALSLWRGAPFADVPETPLVAAEKARLEESRIAALEARIGIEMKLGHHASVLPDLRLLVRQHPLRERLHGHLMLTLYRDGQQAMALAAYHDLRRLLIDELGVEPGSGLRDLHERILRQDPSLLDVTVH